MDNRPPQTTASLMSVPHRKNEKWKPGVSKATLLLLAGMVWLGIGILLNFLAFSWLSIAKAGIVIPLVCVGLAGAIAIHRFGFLRIVDRNLRRILPMEGPRCLFSFMPWKSYLLVAVMMLMGFVLRHSPIPKLYLAVLYLGIGTALILSSYQYLKHVILVIRKGV
jgi:hypothetical protein